MDRGRNALARAIETNNCVESLESRLLLYSGNVLVDVRVNGIDSELREYNSAGTNLHHAAIPSNGSDGGGRDIQVDPSGNIQVWTGTFNPVLQRHNGPLSGTGGWTREASTILTPGWSIINRTFYGGVTVLGQYVFVVDQSTGGGEANGLIRFDSKNNYASQRFAQGSDFSDCTIGMDGKLYAINGGETFQAQVKVFNPLTLAPIKTVNVPGFDDTSVAADSNGNIFVGGFSDGKVWKLSPSGANITSIDVAAKDLDMSSDNQLLTSDGGTVRLLDDNLKILWGFAAGSYTGASFVAFASYQAPPLSASGSIAGNVFNDANGNRAKDAGEAGLASRTVYIDANNNSEREQHKGCRRQRAGRPNALDRSGQ